MVTERECLLLGCAAGPSAVSQAGLAVTGLSLLARHSTETGEHEVLYCIGEALRPEKAYELGFIEEHRETTV